MSSQETRRRPSLLGLIIVVALIAPAAAAARTPILGKLDKTGYSIIAMGRDGRVTQANPKPDGSFSITPPASRVTLQLRAKDGLYGGPVVIGGRGRSLVMGVRDGVDLGAIQVAGGFARVRKAPPKAKQDAGFKARAKGGRPLGAGVFGRVKVSGGSGATEPGADADADGVPNALDVDDDGDLILDALDDRAPQGPLPAQAVVASSLRVPLASSLNVNGGAGVTNDLLDTMLKDSAALTFPLPSSGTYELDCGGLPYCSRNTKMTAAPDSAPSSFVHAPGAANVDLQAGDLFVERRKGRQIAGSLTFAYATVPAVAAWADGTTLGPVGYPASDATEGSAAKPIVVHPRESDGRAVLQLSVWRPQRRAFPGEGDSFVDIGHLRYSIVVDEAPAAASGGGTGAPDAGPGQCSLASYTAPSGDVTGTGPAAHGVLLDSADDLAADPGRRIVFSVDFTTCLAGAGLTWKPNQVLTVGLRAADAGLGFAEQVLTLKLAPATQA